MNEEQRAWLLAQLGPDTDAADLAARFTRLGSARAVALEVLTERRARLLADPLRVTVDGVVTMDQQENLRGIERQLQTVTTGPTPDEPPNTATGNELITTHLRPRHRYR